MQPPPVTLADWRAAVEKELAGKPFEKTLVQQTPEGLSVQPLYLERPHTLTARDSAAEPFRICIRYGDQPVEMMISDVRDGADAIWAPLDQLQIDLMLQPEMAKIFFVFGGSMPGSKRLEQLTAQAAKPGAPQFSLGLSPLEEDEAALVAAAKLVAARAPSSNAITVSTLEFHNSGAEPGFEIACALSAGAHALRILLRGGTTAEQAAGQISLQVAVGRDTFLELCKLRALRACWRKVVTAFGPGPVPRARIHAVCSERTLTGRDPWVNMLRVTTQMFAAITGGADLVTPQEFDAAFGAPSSQGVRVARNTGLVLREESLLGKVADPAGGSYALETLTDDLARKAWEQFRELEREGGLAKAMLSGTVAKRLEASWEERLQSIRKRKMPILGVSEFANLDEKLPQVSREVAFHQESAPFEELRSRAESRSTPPAAALLTLGELSESRGRVGFASSFFAAGGIRSHETREISAYPIACLCGTDERYAEEAVDRVRALKAAGCKSILVAGRPGALEKPLREAGADGFIYVGCDAVEVLGRLLEVAS
jgi:methylmalonyl-CoA mutase